MESTVRWAKPTGPAFGGPDDRLRVPTRIGLCAWARREDEATAQRTKQASVTIAFGGQTGFAIDNEGRPRAGPFRGDGHV